MARTQIVVVSDDVPLRAGPLRDAGPATGRDSRGLEVVAVRRFRDVLIDEQPDAAGRRIFDGRVRGCGRSNLDLQRGAQWRRGRFVERRRYSPSRACTHSGRDQGNAKKGVEGKK